MNQKAFYNKRCFFKPLSFYEQSTIVIVKELTSQCYYKRGFWTEKGV